MKGFVFIPDGRLGPEVGAPAGQQFRLDGGGPAGVLPPPGRKSEPGRSEVHPERPQKTDKRFSVRLQPYLYPEDQ